jgi:hypothetical protein
MNYTECFCMKTSMESPIAQQISDVYIGVDDNSKRLVYCKTMLHSKRLLDLRDKLDNF